MPLYCQLFHFPLLQRMKKFCLVTQKTILFKNLKGTTVLRDIPEMGLNAFLKIKLEGRILFNNCFSSSCKYYFIDIMRREKLKILRT